VGAQEGSAVPLLRRHVVLVIAFVLMICVAGLVGCKKSSPPPDAPKTGDEMMEKWKTMKAQGMKMPADSMPKDVKGSSAE